MRSENNKKSQTTPFIVHWFLKNPPVTSCHTCYREFPITHQNKLDQCVVQWQILFLMGFWRLVRKTYKGEVFRGLANKKVMSNLLDIVHALCQADGVLQETFFKWGSETKQTTVREFQKYRRNYTLVVLSQVLFRSNFSHYYQQFSFAEKWIWITIM